MASGAAALAHLLCIPGGETWYRGFGAGERMARAVGRGDWRPHVVTLGIATTLAVWSAYGLSGAGVLGRLPLLRPALLAITSAYLVRAAALPVMLRAMPDRSRAFLMRSSAIVLAIGLLHAAGLATR